jgi:hypothetical protein
MRVAQCEAQGNLVSIAKYKHQKDIKKIKKRKQKSLNLPANQANAKRGRDRSHRLPIRFFSKEKQSHRLSLAAHEAKVF